MHSKLNLKIYGIGSVGNMELIEENLKSQDGVMSIKAFSSNGRAEIKLEIDDAVINRQQILDVIRLCGDFRIEDGSANKENGSGATPVSAEKDNPAAVMGCNISTDNFDKDVIKKYFAQGFLAGILVSSLALNVWFGYLWFKSGDNNAAAAQVGNQAAQVYNQPSAPSPSPAPAPTPTGAIQNFTITKSDHVRGNFNAPITLVEYSDFECPYCGKHDPTLKQILSDYPGQVRLVYKHFPLGFHANSQKAAEASECADEQNKFWEYHDKIFDNQANGLGIANFKQWARDLGLNTGKFDACLDSGKYADRVRADTADGQNRGVNGTPTTFVNGQAVSGAVPYKSLKTIIDQILNNN